MLTGGLAADSFSHFDFSARSCVVAAVSGGGDSLALLLLLKAHLGRTSPATKLVAATVDHQLRAESAAEARQVANLCAARGIDHLTLPWNGAKPATGVPAAARKARYRLLVEAAKKSSSDLVLTGHNRDDQAETVLMRKRRGEGRGLAGMAPATLVDGTIWIGRPLLGVGRAALRGFLRAERVAWAEDPSNADTAYERVRARRQIASSADPEALKQSLLAQAAFATAARAARGGQASEMIRAHVQKISPGLFFLSPEILTADNGETSVHALRLLLACVGGKEHLPDEERTAALLARVSAGACRATLSGAVVDARKNGIFLRRELRGDGPAAVPAKDGAIWDGRFRIRLSDPTADALTIGPLGKEDARGQELVDGGAPESLQRAAFAAEPVAWPGDERIALTPVIAPYVRFLPCFDLAPARALAELIGAPLIPAPPFAGHIAP